MDISILDALGTAISTLFQFRTLLYICLGVAIGTLLAVIPGVGALMGMALLLPFTFSLDAHTAIIFMLSALAVMTTADSIPAILFGVPGTPGSMATVMDGYPMAKNGEAGRAMGAAFASSVLGGIVGAGFLLLSIPFIMPLLMATTSTELLAFCILGLAMVAALSGGAMLKGLAVAGVGILFAFIGMDGQTATMRWTFGQVYLWDGVNVLLVVLGIYALPELADLAIERASIAKDKAQTSQMKGGGQGVRDTLAHPWIVLRSSGIGAILGTLPAVGASVIPWLVYSYTTMRTKKDPKFGKGDVRGVIAVESSNNATVGGTLLPTIALGIPGSAPMALLLGAFMMQGIAPGPRMLAEELPLTFMLVLTTVVANVIGGVFAFALAMQLARIVFLRVTILVPIILPVVFIGALQASRQWQDLVFLLGIGLIGWLMKRVRWSRSPLVLAFILAPLVEQYYQISVRLHGWQWVLKPAVAVILVGTVMMLVGLAVRSFLRTRKKLRDGQRRAFRPRIDADTIAGLLVCAAGAAAFVTADAWPAAARTMPQFAAGFTFVTALGAVLTGWWRPVGPATLMGKPDEEEFYDVATDFGDMPRRVLLLRCLHYAGFAAGFVLLATWIGILPAIPVFVLAFMLTAGERWQLAVPVALGVAIGCHLVFNELLSLTWPRPVWDLMALLGLR